MSSPEPTLPHEPAGLNGDNRPEVRARKILWATTCAKDMWEASGKDLVASFATHHIPGTLAVALEGVRAENAPASVRYFDIADCKFLKDFLENNADVIPEHLGGRATEPLCRCPGGPYAPHGKHKMPCVGQWFCKNQFRWFRKVVTQRLALDLARTNGFDTLIWLDVDCYFKQPVDDAAVARWFHGDKAVFYLKNNRPHLDAGVLGFDVTQGGDSVIEAVVNMYDSGEYRKQKRWDDAPIYQWCIDRSTCKTIDIAYSVDARWAVVPYSPVEPYIEHEKGKHCRTPGIVT